MDLHTLILFALTELAMAMSPGPAVLLAMSYGSHHGLRGAAMGGAGIEAGALWRPDDCPFRVGLSARTAVRGKADPSNQLTAKACFPFRRKMAPPCSCVPWTPSLFTTTELPIRRFEPSSDDVKKL